MKAFSHDVKIRTSLRATWNEGVVSSVTLVILDYCLIPYALFLHATTAQIGLLVAIPSLLSAISQLFAVRVVQWIGSRLKVLVWSMIIQTVILAPLIVLPFKSFSYQIILLLISVSIFHVLGAIMGPAWGSLVSDYLAPEKRGRYFGRRQRAVGIASIMSLFFSGVGLFYLKKISPILAFSSLFFIITLFRAISLFFMAKMIDLPLHTEHHERFNFRVFIKRFRENNFMKFVLYASSITFATQMAAPYFSMYLLRDLHYNFISYMAVHLSFMISSLIAFPLWGHHADFIGNAKILKLNSLLIPLAPFLWCLSPNVFYLMTVEAFSGFIWSGFNLSTGNFIYDSVSSPQRVRCLGYYNLINSAAIFAGTSLGGQLEPVLPRILGNSLITLFILSGIMRLLADFFLSRHFEEVRITPHRHISSIKLFLSVMGVRPVNVSESNVENFPAIEDLKKPVPKPA